jgi:hypothetical protein
MFSSCLGLKEITIKKNHSYRKFRNFKIVPLSPGCFDSYLTASSGCEIQEFTKVIAKKKISLNLNCSFLLTY